MTVKELFIIIGEIAGAIASLTAIGIALKKLLEKCITSPIISRIDCLDKEACMNYLTEFLADVRNGVAKSDYQVARAHDVYKHYSEVLKGNSYIHEQWEKYMKGK